MEIVTYLHQVRGVRCSPEQIVVGTGTYHSLDLLFQPLKKKDVTCMVVEASINDGVKALFEQFRFDSRPLWLESDGLRIEEVYASKAQAVYVTPSHQFPFGVTLSVNKRIKLLNWTRNSKPTSLKMTTTANFVTTVGQFHRCKALTMMDGLFTLASFPKHCVQKYDFF
nr:hypothetical protein [Evansella caseinilytica]